MKSIFLFILIIPFLAFSQSDSEAGNKPSDVFEITGNIAGYPDGTSVSFLNQQTNTPEKQTEFKNGKFAIKGTHLDEPSFVILIFGDQPPAIPLFMDNSKIILQGDKNSLENLSVSGSKTEMEYAEYSKSLKPYEHLFARGVADKDTASIAAVEKISEEFVKTHPSSYVGPIAIIRILQASGNPLLADKLYKVLEKPVQQTNLAKYVNQQLELAKINPIGSEIADFSQADTSGHKIKISSLRGKYVLIDFWASWCGPCRRENPNVVAAYNKYHQKNFTILGVSLDQAKAAWLKAIHMDGLYWNQVSDLKGWGNEVAAQFKITSIPQNILIDPKGIIIAKNLRGEALDQKLDEILQ